MVFSMNLLNLNLGSIIQGKTPDFTGITENPLQFVYDPAKNPAGQPIPFYGTQVPETYSNCFVIDHRGYLVTTDNVNYNLFLRYVDDVAYAWIGDAALSGNFNVSTSVVHETMWGGTNAQTSFNFNASTTTTVYAPIRVLYANIDNAGGYFDLPITPSDFSTPEFVTSCSNIDDAPPFPDWADELVKPFGRGP